MNKTCDKSVFAHPPTLLFIFFPLISFPFFHYPLHLHQFITFLLQCDLMTWQLLACVCSFLPFQSCSFTPAHRKQTEVRFSVTVQQRFKEIPEPCIFSANTMTHDWPGYTRSPCKSRLVGSRMRTDEEDGVRSVIIVSYSPSVCVLMNLYLLSTLLAPLCGIHTFLYST